MRKDVNRRCSVCIDEHGRIERDTPRFWGYAISRGGSPVTFQCSTCGRRAYWNSGNRTPSLLRWVLDLL